MRAAAIFAAACASPDRPAAVRHDAAAVARPAGYVVDSILPIEEHLRRFRTGLPQADSLRGGAGSERELVERFLAAVAARDSAALGRMVLTRAEFGWLYYPAHVYSRPPYELDPGSFWTLIQGNSSKGFTRLLREYGGRQLEYRSHECRPSDAAGAPVHEWNRCEVRLTVDGGRGVKRLFGSVVEIGGRWKFVSYANDL